MEEEYYLPELNVTPRGNYIYYTGDESFIPSLLEYQNARINQRKIEAANAMVNLKKPLRPTVPSKLGRAFKKGIHTITGKDISDKDIISVFGITPNPETCIYNSTYFYGHPIPGNITFAKNPQAYGFVPTNNPEVGNLILFAHDGIPHHTVMVTGWNKDKLPTVTYPRGKLNDGIVYDSDTIFGDLQGEPYLYYTFIGTDEDRRMWTDEYNRKFKK